MLHTQAHAAQLAASSTETGMTAGVWVQALTRKVDESGMTSVEKLINRLCNPLDSQQPMAQASPLVCAADGLYIMCLCCDVKLLGAKHLVCDALFCLRRHHGIG